MTICPRYFHVGWHSWNLCASVSIVGVFMSCFMTVMSFAWYCIIVTKNNLIMRHASDTVSLLEPEKRYFWFLQVMVLGVWRRKFSSGCRATPHFSSVSPNLSRPGFDGTCKDRDLNAERRLEYYCIFHRFSSPSVVWKSFAFLGFMLKGLHFFSSHIKKWGRLECLGTAFATQKCFKT